MNPKYDNGALRRTGSAVTACEANLRRLSTHLARSRLLRLSLMLGSLGPMRLLLAILLPMTAVCGQPDIAKIPWPKQVSDFPDGEKVTFRSANFRISRRVPDDPAVQAGGGSGGPIVEFTLRDINSRWSTTFSEQSVGERLLETFQGRPQIEIWGRGGGGYWSRSLYRYISGEYRRVRTDQFEERPRHHNQNAPTTEMPSARRGKGDQQSETLYFVGTQLPEP